MMLLVYRYLRLKGFNVYDLQGLLQLKHLGDSFTADDLTTKIEVDWAQVAKVSKTETGTTIVLGDVKIYITKVSSTDSNAFYTCNFPAGFFTEPPYVINTSETQETGDAAGNATYACVYKDSVTTLGCRGRTKGASTVGLLAAMVNVSITTVVTVLAIGK